MRAAFGLVGVLGLLVAIIFFWSSAYLPYTQKVITSGQSAQSRAEQMAGIDSGLGGRVTQHLAFAPVQRGGRLEGLQVKSSDPGSSYARYYGIKVNDVIEYIGPQMVKDMDAQTAEALALEAYQRKWDLGVLRDGQRILLPQSNASVTPPLPQPGVPVVPVVPQPTAVAPAAPQPPAQPAPVPQRNISPLNRQLDALTNRQRDD